MELSRQTAPSQTYNNNYTFRDPAEIDLPTVPRHELSRTATPSDLTLPDLKTVLSPEFEQSSSPHADRVFARHQSPLSVRSLPPIDPGPLYNGNASATRGRSSIDSGTGIKSPSDTGSRMSLDRGRSSSITVTSMDDEKVRIAAEALSGLGNPEYARSSPSSVTAREMELDRNTPVGPEEPEPLLQLFARAHPWVGGTINGSISAYSTTKHYSPRFVQYGANLVERNITTPVVSTVSSVGRMTGVESGLRWYYGGTTRPRDLEEGMDEVRLADSDIALRSGQARPTIELRQDSVDSVMEPPPSYHQSKPPSYREEVSPSASDRLIERPSHNRSWSSHVFVMTSGLGVALSEASRRSLVFCLGMLGQAAQHVQTVTDALRMVLEQYDTARNTWRNTHGDAMEKGNGRGATPEHDEAARVLAEIIKKHSDDIWNTLKVVVNYISNSAGGALPENARHFVRSQLMSMPQRWRFVSEESNSVSHTSASETSRAASRMIAFATEGLDMMSQVSQTMRLTLDSAEKWLERVGRREQFINSTSAGLAPGRFMACPVRSSMDHEMTDADERGYGPEKV